MNFAAFLYYIFLTAFTPGPNNIMSMINAGKYGFKKSFRFNLGIFAGFLVVMAVCAIFSSVLYSLIPSVKTFMLCIGALYMTWLAWTIWQDKPHENNILRTNSFASGLMLQFINIKVFLYGLTTMSSYILPHYSGLPVVGFAFLLAFVGFLGTCCWAIFGSAFERLFKQYGKILNAVMALSLLYCAAAILAEI